MWPVLCQVSGVHVTYSACCVAEQGSLWVVDSEQLALMMHVSHLLSLVMFTYLVSALQTQLWQIPQPSGYMHGYTAGTLLSNFCAQ